MTHEPLFSTQPSVGGPSIDLLSGCVMRARFLLRAFKTRYRDQRTEIRAALDALQSGAQAVDVGAYKGSYLHWLRKAVGPQGRVFAFEPQPKLARYLEMMCAAMKWKNVRIYDRAVSDVVGRATLNVPGYDVSPGASLEQAVAGGTPCRAYECIVDTLDRHLQDAGRIDFLKVDAEGHELQVFRGAAGVLSRFMPVILFECETRHLSKHSMQDVFSHLQNLGYQGEFFSPLGLRPLREFDPAVHQKSDSERFWDALDYCNNFLFKPRRPG